MQNVSVLLIGFGQGVAYCAIAFAFIVVAKWIDDKRTVRFDDDMEVVERSNLAVGFRRTGLYVGYAVALAGALSGPTTGFANDVVVLLVDSVLITACMFGCREINDRIMLPNVDNDDEAEKGNPAVGLAECGMYLATGLTLNGAFSGGGAGLAVGVASAVVFFVLGQLALLGGGICYEMMTPYSIRKEIADGNSSAGLSLAAALVALGFVLRASVAGPFNGWGQDILAFVLSAVYGMLLLLVFTKLSDWLLLPKTTLSEEVARDRNVAAVAVTHGVLIAVAVMIGAVI